MRTDLLAVWAEIEKPTIPGETGRLDIPAQLAVVARDCERDAAEALSDWTALIDEAIQVLLQLHRVFSREQMREPDAQRGTILMGLSRGAACLVGVRRLCLHGLEDVARPVTRSLVETLDVSLLCLLDKGF